MKGSGKQCGNNKCIEWDDKEDSKCLKRNWPEECKLYEPLTTDSDGVAEVALDCGVKPAACIWEYNSDKFGEDTWQTSCGNSFILLEGVPNDNKMKYCCYCGGSLIEKQV